MDEDVADLKNYLQQSSGDFLQKQENTETWTGSDIKFYAQHIYTYIDVLFSYA